MARDDLFAEPALEAPETAPEAATEAGLGDRFETLGGPDNTIDLALGAREEGAANLVTCAEAPVTVAEERLHGRVSGMTSPTILERT